MQIVENIFGRNLGENVDGFSQFEPEIENASTWLALAEAVLIGGDGGNRTRIRIDFCGTSPFLRN